MLHGVVPDAPDYFAGRAGDSPYQEGERIAPGTVLPKPVLAWYHLEVPPEPPIPFDYQILHVDDDLIVVDKPHFLPTTSNGRIVRETLQTRLRQDFGEDDIVPLHRLDRLTAGIVVCSRRAATRAAYQRIFAERNIDKHYVAWCEGLVGSMTVELGMRRVRGARQVLVDATGTPTVTHLRGIGKRVDLWPVTGHTHQLRVVMAHLGAPILGDDTYPVDRGLDLYDFSTPLQLYARSLKFKDPFSGDRLQFMSSLTMPCMIK